MSSVPYPDFFENTGFSKGKFATEQLGVWEGSAGQSPSDFNNETRNSVMLKTFFCFTYISL